MLHSKKANKSFWDLGDFEAEFAAAKERALPVLQQVMQQHAAAAAAAAAAGAEASGGGGNGSGWGSEDEDGHYAQPRPVIVA